MPSMLAVNRLLPGGGALGRSLIARAGRVSLDWSRRQRSRLSASDSAGRALAIVLARGTVLRDGDVLVAEDGSLLRVEAAKEPVMIVRAPAGSPGSLALARAAYHLGNRHVSLDVRADSLRLEPDGVLEAMLRRLGLEVAHALAPFEPEGGAYAEHGHAHDHGQLHRHDPA